MERFGGAIRTDRDWRVWQGEERWDGPVILEDLRDPAVLAKVRRIAAEQETRLYYLMKKAGLSLERWAAPPPEPVERPQRVKQPALAICRAEGMSVRAAAQYCDVPEVHLRNALHGVVSPRAEVRDRLPAYVGRPLEELFTADALARSPRTGGGYRPAPAKPWEQAA